MCRATNNLKCFSQIPYFGCALQPRIRKREKCLQKKKRDCHDTNYKLINSQAKKGRDFLHGRVFNLQRPFFYQKNNESCKIGLKKKREIAMKIKEMDLDLEPEGPSRRVLGRSSRRSSGGRHRRPAG